MKNENRFKLNMNKETKRAVVVLSIIALLILIAGLVSCSMQLRQGEPPLSPSGQEAITPDTDKPGDLIVDIDKDGDKAEPSSDTGEEKSEDGDKKPVAPSKPTDKQEKPTIPPVKPTEPIAPTPTPVKPTEPPKPPVKPTEPEKPDNGGSGGGSGGGGSVSYPAAMVEIIAPDYSHANTEFEVKSTQRNVKAIEWKVAEDGKDTPPSAFLKGTLEKSGGKIAITKPGKYIITATTKNYGGSTYTFSKEIIIHPTFDIKVEVEKTPHTDKAFIVKTALSENVTQQLNWHIYKDGKEVKWQDTVTGALTNEGGSIQIKEQGSYTLKATAFDETSREFSGKAEVAVYPVIEILVQAPEVAHTDTAVAITANTKELGDLNLVWTTTKDGKDVPLSDCTEGSLDNSGGSLRFTQKGSYTLTATATDTAGRAFTAKTDITIYPVAAFSFTLPATTHTDKMVEIAVKSFELQDMTAEWTVIYNGKIVKPAAVISGNLTNEGGSIRFKLKGTYILKATLFDKAGREYSHEAKTVVYPVAETGFYLPPQTHTDTTVEVETTFKDAENLTSTWTLTKDGKHITLTDGFEGTLHDNGGKIRFKETSKYELKATVTDSTGRSFTYTATTTVYPVISVLLELPKETHTDRPAKATAKTENGSTLPIKWRIAKDGIPAGGADISDNIHSDGDGTFRFDEKGSYSVTAYVTDETGRGFSASKTIKVFPVPTMKFTLPAAVHNDDVLAVDTILTDMENLTAVWYVDNTFGFQDWNTYIDGALRNSGGSIRFKRAGVYDLQARVTDATERVFLFNSGKVEVLPVLTLTFDLPETGHTDTMIDVRTRGNNGVLPIEWVLMKNGTVIPIEQAVSGSLNSQGGKIRFISDGEYRLTATMFDALGRVFTASQKISIHPLYNCDFTMPSSIHTGQSFVVAIGSDANLGGKNIVWTADKDGQGVAIADHFKGVLSNNGGTVQVDTVGSYNLTATITDELGRVFSDTQSIVVTNTAPTKPTLIANVSRTYASGKFFVDLTANSTDADGDAITYEYHNKAADNYYPLGTHTVKVRAKDNFGGVSDWAEVTFTVENSAPTAPTVTANVTRTVKDGKILVNLTVNSIDADGDTITYEYQNKTADNYYPVGTHTVKVRAKDNYVGVSDWAAVTFSVANSEPTRPVITRTPNSNSVVPGTPVTITASSTDADGDAITYLWEGRPAQTTTYPLGKNTVRVKAVDSTGAESPWAAIVFFVMDSSGSGGMVLTGPDSTINENGIEGATITNYTFTVPPVSGHSGQDYGRVRGYNIKTGTWDQLDYGTTSNGITFTRTLTAGTYSKLEMYYYTNHSCMYNKANITYTVDYYFE